MRNSLMVWFPTAAKLTKKFTLAKFFSWFFKEEWGGAEVIATCPAGHLVCSRGWLICVGDDTLLQFWMLNVECWIWNFCTIEMQQGAFQTLLSCLPSGGMYSGYTQDAFQAWNNHSAVNKCSAVNNHSAVNNIMCVSHIVMRHPRQEYPLCAERCLCPVFYLLLIVDRLSVLRHSIS